MTLATRWRVEESWVKDVGSSAPKMYRFSKAFRVSRVSSMLMWDDAKHDSTGGD